MKIGIIHISMSTSKKKWTGAESRLLISKSNFYKGKVAKIMSDPEVKKLNRSQKSVQSKLNQLKLKKKKIKRSSSLESTIN